MQLGVEPPLWDVSELGGVIPVDTKKPFDVRAVIARYAMRHTPHHTHLHTQRVKLIEAPSLLCGCVCCVV
jgi:acetyl-CoA carboxylase carboxyltransferase component